MQEKQIQKDSLYRKAFDKKPYYKPQKVFYLRVGQNQYTASANSLHIGIGELSKNPFQPPHDKTNNVAERTASERLERGGEATEQNGIWKFHGQKGCF